MKKTISLLIIIILFFSCASNKMGMLRGNSSMLDIAIADFLSCRLSRNHRVFSIDQTDANEKFSVLSIVPLDFTFYITLLDTLGSTRLPTRHLIRNGKLFYWYDSKYGLTEELVNTFSRYNLIADTICESDLIYVLGKGSYFDEQTRGADYFFCKNDTTKFKRIITNKALGWYDPPKLRCK